MIIEIQFKAKSFPRCAELCRPVGPEDECGGRPRLPLFEGPEDRREGHLLVTRRKGRGGGVAGLEVPVVGLRTR